MSRTRAAAAQERGAMSRAAGPCTPGQSGSTMWGTAGGCARPAPTRNLAPSTARHNRRHQRGASARSRRGLRRHRRLTGGRLRARWREACGGLQHCAVLRVTAIHPDAPPHCCRAAAHRPPSPQTPSLSTLAAHTRHQPTQRAESQAETPPHSVPTASLPRGPPFAHANHAALNRRGVLERRGKATAPALFPWESLPQGTRPGPAAKLRRSHGIRFFVGLVKAVAPFPGVARRRTRASASAARRRRRLVCGKLVV